ncbi:unnamed protein product [Linum trigynum]|uniref:Uncharacterized protein n=1 Tax=Linum trigynum TaxID=586398 RepID=A0AAV2D4Y8_9ROSI
MAMIMNMPNTITKLAILLPFILCMLAALLPSSESARTITASTTAASNDSSLTDHGQINLRYYETLDPSRSIRISDDPRTSKYCNCDTSVRRRAE